MPGRKKDPIPSNHFPLGTLLNTFENWAILKGGIRYNPLDGSLREYPGWENLALEFLSFLRSKPIADWTKQESLAVEKGVTMDWAHHLLLRSVPDNELFDLLTLPYTDQVVRMYMLVRGSQVKNKPIREKIALHFFEHDGPEAVRDYAFEVLARGKWIQTEHFAKTWWDSGDLLKRMTALKVLQAADSQLLSYYLNLAASSNNSSLKSHASAMAVMRAAEREILEMKGSIASSE